MLLKMDVKLIPILLVVCVFIVNGSAYQQCNIICDDDHTPSPPTVANPIRGKAGPKGSKGSKGQKGEAAAPCECSSMDDLREELAITKKELTKLQRKPRDCLDIKQTYPMLTSGAYRIFPSFEHTFGFQVYCDMETDGGGWIVFQKRQDGSVDFFRNWDEYVQGFGELTGEFWLGLELVHRLTSNGTFDLRVDLTDFEQNSAYAQYGSFSIGEGTNYNLNYEGYTGTAGNGFAHSNFSTKDRDQDTNPRANCAVSYNGAWWYTACHSSNLNGLYLEGHTERYATGMVWKPWKGYHYSLKTSQMKFRRVGV